MNSFDKQRDGKLRPVFRLTHERLSPAYGLDQDKPLVVGLEAGDIISFRPKGTRRTLTVPALEVYNWAIRRKVLAEQREMKQMKKLKKANGNN